MKKVVYLLLVLCLILTGLIILEIKDITKGKKDWNIEIVKEYDCDLQMSDCELILNDELGKIKIVERPIMINKKHEVRVSLGSLEVDELWIDFKGIELDMGYNRLRLKQIDSYYQGQMYLPSCTLNEMTWKAMVIMKIDDKMYGHVYKFKTVKNHEN